MTSSELNVILNLIGLVFQAATLVWVVVEVHKNGRLIEKMKGQSQPRGDS